MTPTGIGDLVGRLTKPIDWKHALNEGDQWQIDEDRREAAAALQAVERERDEARRIIAACAGALPNGAFIDAERASLRFMSGLPAEITAVCSTANAEVERLTRERDEARAAISTPVIIHANMLRGTMPKLSIMQALHLHGADAVDRWNAIDAMARERDGAQASARSWQLSYTGEKERGDAWMADAKAAEASLEGLEVDVAAGRRVYLQLQQSMAMLVKKIETADTRAASAEASLATANAEVQRLREALKPFAEYMETSMDCDHLGKPLPDESGVGWVYLSQGDFRRARSALSQGSKE